MATVASLSRLSSAAGSTSAADVVRHDDGRLSDARTPTAHGDTHAQDGTDPIPGIGGYATGTVPSGSTTAVIEHDLGTADVAVIVQDVGAHLITPVAVETVDGAGTASVDHVRLTFSSAPTTGQYRYLILSGAPASGPGPSTAPIDLTDAATIATDASLGTHFRVSMGGNRTLGAPTNPADGQRAIWQVTASGADRTLTLATGGGGFAFGADITALTTTPSGTTDFIGCLYDASADRWRVLAYTKGY